MKHTYRCMKNEASFAREAWLRHTENGGCASLHRSRRLLLHTRLRVLHICEANASLFFIFTSKKTKPSAFDNRARFALIKKGGTYCKNLCRPIAFFGNL